MKLKAEANSKSALAQYKYRLLAGRFNLHPRTLEDGGSIEEKPQVGLRMSQL